MRRILLHFLFWVAYVLALTYLNVTSDVKSFELLPSEAFSQLYQHISAQVIFLIVKVPFVYTALFLLDQYLHQKSKLIYLITIVGFLLAICSVLLNLIKRDVVLPYLFNIYESEYSLFSTGSVTYFGLALAFVTGIAATLKLMRWQYKTQLQVITLQKQMTEAELKYLKGQINPHFLFNTLNNIYSLARKGSTATADSVLKLSKLMRFMLFEASNPRILLRSEIELIQDYIELERLRYTDRVQINFKHDLDYADQKIAPLLLIHFVENAFKHGVSESLAESFVNVYIQLKDGILTAIIQNRLPETDRMTLTKPVGMENINRQLELLYPDHSLDVSKENLTFKVVLRIPLH